MRTPIVPSSRSPTRPKATSTRRFRAGRHTRHTGSPLQKKVRCQLTATDPQGLLDLVDWRRRVGDLYRTTGPDAVGRFRRGRDELFRTHPQSPIEPEERGSFAGLHYFAHDPAYRVSARCEPGEGSELLIDTGGEDGAVRHRRARPPVFPLPGQPSPLPLLTLVQYAGGLFVPFRHGPSARAAYGGGRYLF